MVRRLGISGIPRSANVQKSYFMLSNAGRNVLNTALKKYRPGQSDAILVGAENVLKPALRLMTNYLLVIEKISRRRHKCCYFHNGQQKNAWRCLCLKWRERKDSS
jgi:hypothetical protein